LHPPNETGVIVYIWGNLTSDNLKLWTEVHAEVQQQLDVLEREVRRQVENVCVKSLQTNGERVYLFTYKTFAGQDESIDPVVVGITFSPHDGGILVEADASGERTGDLIYPLPTETAPDAGEKILEIARDVARKLCHSASAVADAVCDPSRRTD
jgi:hypothetical protein